MEIPSPRKRHIPRNFIFVIINRIYMALNHFSAKERLVMGLYSIISHLKQSMSRALGFDTSNVLVENAPLVVKPHRPRVIKRIDGHKDNEPSMP